MDWTALVVLACLALLLMLPAGASAAPLASIREAVPAAASAVVPADHRRHAKGKFLRKHAVKRKGPRRNILKKLLKQRAHKRRILVEEPSSRRRRPHGSHKPHGPWQKPGHDWHPRSADRDHDPDRHHHHRHHRHHRHHWHWHHAREPRLPPLIILPDLPPERAEVLRSLPRRVQQPPQGRSLANRMARQILVLVDSSRPQSLGSDLARAHGMQMLSSRPISLLGARAELFRVRPGHSESTALAALRRDPRVRSAQFNWRYFHTADDRRQAGRIPQYAPRKVHLAEAHKLALGRNVAVAVIDSAVDTAHPDLKGVVVRSFDVVGGADATPDFHGTAVAGIISSHGVVEGVAPQAGIIAVRAFRTRPGALPETTTDLLLTAIDLAVANGARVLNMSFVGPRSGHLEALLRAASRKGVVLVAAAGNGGPKAPPAYPAAFPGVIAVTAVDARDRRYEYANRGRYITVAAPGVDVLAPVDGGKHELLSGTSFATAYVSGIAALLLERDPGLDAAAIAGLIAAGADDLGPAGRDDDFGAGRVDAFAALKSMRKVAAREDGPGVQLSPFAE